MSLFLVCSFPGRKCFHFPSKGMRGVLSTGSSCVSRSLSFFPPRAPSRERVDRFSVLSLMKSHLSTTVGFGDHFPPSTTALHRPLYFTTLEGQSRGASLHPRWTINSSHLTQAPLLAKHQTRSKARRLGFERRITKSI
jgi:hypothetical protein